MLPVGSAPELSASNKLNLAFTTLRGHYYVLEASTNLVDWQVVADFTAAGVTSSLVDSQSPQLKRRFYRLRDDTGFNSFSGVVLDATTSLPIAGTLIYSVGDGTETFADASGHFYLKTTLQGGDELKISAVGYINFTNFYYGSGLFSGLQIYLATPPPNDNFVNRIIITGTSITNNGSNIGATREIGEPYDIGGTIGGKSVWWSWTAPHSGPVTISTIGSNFDTILGVYTGTVVSALTKIASDDESGGNSTSLVTFSATTGVTYQISVDGYGGNSGRIRLNISMP